MKLTDVQAEIKAILNKFEDWVECEEWHIHGSTDPEAPNTHETNDHKDFDEEVAPTLATKDRALDGAALRPHSEEGSK